MEYIGIVGSSHSTGEHYLENNQVTKLFTEHCYKHSSNKTFINCAHGGKGSELYLNQIVYLKDKYNIKKLLIEIIHDRSDINANLSKEENKPTLNGKEYKKINYLKSFDRLFQNTAEYPKQYFLKTYIADNVPEGIFGKTLNKKEKHWREIQSVIASDYNMRNYWSMVNIGLSLKLCKMLGIKTVAWSQKENFEELPLFNEIIKNVNYYVKFENHYNAFDYYSSRYSKDKLLCDVCHFSEDIEEEMIKQFLLPALDQV